MSSSEWIYLDDERNEQGPFSSEDMTGWFSEYFTEDTKCRKVGDTGPFIEVGKQVPRPEFAGPIPISVAKDGDGDRDVNNSRFEDITDITEPLVAENASTIAATTSTTTTSESVPEVDSNTSATEEAKVIKKVKPTWFYTDSKGVEQGPWKKKQMLHWIKKGFFTHNDCLVRRSDEAESVKFSLRRDPQFVIPITTLRPMQINPQSHQTLIQPQATLISTPSDSTSSKTSPTTISTDSKSSASSAEPEWYYLDQSDKEQGPWTSQQMRDWYQANFLAQNVRVRQASEPADKFSPLSERDCCFKQPIQQPSFPLPPVPPVFPGANMYSMGGTGRGGPG